MNRSFVLHGDLCYCESPERFVVYPDGWLVCLEGRSAGAFATLPAQYGDLPREEHSGRLIVPGLYDLHLHAPQYAYRGLGMDLELIDWLDQRAFPEETRYADLAYARVAYRQFAEALKNSFTVRACVFATRHVPATLLLTELLEDTGLAGYVGKVNMDRNAPAPLCEQSAAQSLTDTREWLEQAALFKQFRPILTPRFIPSCTDELMQGLRTLQRTRGLPMQSHLSENETEIEWVRSLCPEADGYADAYDRFGVLESRTVMAHVVHPTEKEIALLAARGVTVAHCPASNMNLSSGIAPIRRLWQAGASVGLGSDVAGGQTLDIFRAVTDAIQMSKLYWRLVDQTSKPLTLPEAFYLATKGGGRYFGKAGSFEPGYELDALVIDDSALVSPNPLQISERLARVAYDSGRARLTQKYVSGQPVITRKENT